MTDDTSATRTRGIGWGHRAFQEPRVVPNDQHDCPVKMQAGAKAKVNAPVRRGTGLWEREEEVRLVVARPREPWAGLGPPQMGPATLTYCCARQPIFSTLGGCRPVTDNGGLEAAFALEQV